MRARFHLALFALLPVGLSAQTAPITNQVVVLAVENDFRVLRAGARDWDKAYQGQVLHPGDQGRTYERSRATLQMQDLSIARFNENSFFQIQAVPETRQTTAFTLLKGLAYFFHRQKPAEVKVTTPTSSAAIRGTEFTLEQREDGRTVLTLIDGAVELSNLQGQSIQLLGHEQGIVEPGKAPSKTAVINTASTIQWCLYYPAVLDLDELQLTNDEKRTLAESLAAYRSGDLLQALAKYLDGRQPASDMEKVYFGALLLSVGQVERASNILADVQTQERKVAELAVGLRRLVAAVNVQRPTSNVQPSTATALLAESYYEQAQSQLDRALANARRAVERSSNFGFGWERVAELEFSFGHAGPARAALERSLKLAPRNAQALALKGFLLSADGDFDAAIKSFNEAIQIDGALANAWLGRGLCRFHKGEREAGRADLQTAAALEPDRSVLRSYLGKALSQLGYDDLARKELKLAKSLDPNDPTPWLYSAIEKRRQNQINPAVEDLEKSIDLNENRGVYRSRLLLDQDRAVRSANLANIYQSAGMTDVSVREAARSVNADYGNYSAHLFLAESYDALRDPTRFNLRYETAWFNELLLANLLAPVGANSLSQNVSQQEYFKLFDANRIGFSSLTDYRSDGQVREVASQFGNIGKSDYALDVDFQHNDGIRPNNELDRVEFYGTIKQQLTPQDSVMVLTKYQDYHSGDNFQYYDWRHSVRTNFTFDEFQTPILVAGYHHEWAPGVHTLFLGGRLINDQRFTDRAVPEAVLFKDAGGNVVASGAIGFDVNHRSELEIYTSELNQIFQTERQTLIVGGRFQIGDFKTHSLLSNPSGNTNLFSQPPADIRAKDDFKRGSAYAYYGLELPLHLRITLGGSYDYLLFPQNFRAPPIQSGTDSRDKYSPKAAVVWNFLPEATFRGVYTRSLGGVSLDESFRLEPAQLAGFSQAFRTLIPESEVGSVSAPSFETWGAALDLKFKTHTYVGIQGELLESEVRQTVGVFDYNNFTAPIVPSSTSQRLNFRERSASVTIDQLLGREWSVGAQYRFTSSELNSVFPSIPTFLPSSSSRDKAELQQLNLRLLYNHPSGVFARAESQWYWQKNLRASSGLPGDSFEQLNLFCGYRFPRQYATITLGVLNVTGGDYHLNPLNVYTELPRKCVFTARVLINF